MNQQDRDEFIILKQDVSHIKEDVKEIKNNSESLNNTMIKLTSKLFNDEDTGEKGLFDITKRHGVRLTKIENIKAIGLGVVMVAGMLLGYYLKVSQL